jgi:hypothetical protein
MGHGDSVKTISQNTSAPIPGTYVYYPSNVNVDMCFCDGYWYRPYRGQWFVSAEYNGPWGSIAIQRVPSVLINLPSHYRHAYPGYEPMSYGMVKRNWRTWENERYWDNYESGRGHAYYHGDGDERYSSNVKKADTNWLKFDGKN